MNFVPTSLDINRLREETPALKADPSLIHFNNAGAALMPETVAEATREYLDSEILRGGYETFDKYESKLEMFYEHAAQLIGADSREIAFIENATRAWDMAFYSLPFTEGDNLVTSEAEYASNYIAYLQTQKRMNIEIRVAPNDASGSVDPERLKTVVDTNTKLITITHIPTSGGQVNPAAEVGKFARENDILFLLDACQSVGQMAIDVEELGCDFLSATGRKYLRGPRGTGFLYVNKRWLGRIEPVFLDLHAATWTEKDNYRVRDDAKAFENWEQNFCGKLGLSRAIEYANNLGTREIERRIFELGHYFREELNKVPGLTVTDSGAIKCGIVTIKSDLLPAKKIADSLKRENINLSTSSVLGTRLDMEARKLPELVRMSVHYYNTESEVDRCINFLKEMHRR